MKSTSHPTPRVRETLPGNLAKRPSPRESALVTQILATLRALPETWAVKVHGSIYSAAGTPDILGSHRGRAIALEVKRHGGRVTSIQKRHLALWNASGAVCGVVHDVGEVRELLGLAEEKSA